MHPSPDSRAPRARLAGGERDRFEALGRGWRLAVQGQADALAPAREEVLAARREPGVDPDAADRVLHRLDLRTVLLD